LMRGVVPGWLRSCPAASTYGAAMSFTVGLLESD
jgi:hypothetical protein